MSTQGRRAEVIQTAIGLTPERWLPDGAPDPLMHKRGLIGAPVSRVDGPLKVQGNARFAAEVAMERMTYAALVHSTIARGRIVRIVTAAAEAAPGVVLVMTYKNAPRMKPPALFGTSPSAAGASSLPIMQDASIHWNGEAVALALAETQEQADHAASLVEVTYDAEPAVTSFAVAKARSHPPESILGEPPSSRSAMPRRRSTARRWLSTAPLSHAAPQPQRDRTPRRDDHVGGRPAHHP